MDSTRRPARRIKEALLAILVGLILFAGLLRMDRPVHREALIRDAIAGHLLSGDTVGRQALVGSVWWAPLPSLMLVPLRYVVPWLPAGSAALLFASLCAVLTLWALYRFARIRLSRIESAYLVIASAMMPGAMALIAAGSGYSWNLLLTIALLAAYHGWRREHSLRALVLFGSAGGLIAVSGLALFSWAVLVVGLLAVHEIARRTSAAEKRAVMLLAVLPGLYMGGLWVLMNWLLMGDPIYFLRTWRAAMPWPGSGAGITVSWPPVIGLLFVYGLALSGLAVVARRGASFCMAVAAMLWIVPMTLFAHLDLIEMRVGTVLSMALGVVMATAVLAGSMDRRRSFRRLALCLMPLALVLVVRMSPLRPSTGYALTDAPVNRQAILQAVRMHVTRPDRSYVKVFVAGFEGLHLLSGFHDATFVPVLDVDVDQMALDYPGQRLYLLIHRPVGAAALDGIHVKYPDIYRRGGPRSLYDRDWGAWRLFEVSGIEEMPAH